MIISLGVLNILLFSLFTFRFIHEAVYTKRMDTTRLLLDYAARTVDERMVFAEEILKLLTEEPLLRNSGSPSYLKQKIITNYGSLIPRIDHMIFVEESGEYYTSGEVSFPPSYEPRERDWYRNALESHETLYWSDPFLDFLDQDILFSAVTKVRDDEGNFKGILAAHFDVNEINESFNDFELEERDYLMLVSRNGTILANKKAFFIGEEPFYSVLDSLKETGRSQSLEVNIQGSAYLALGRQLTSSGMLFISAVNKQDIQRKLSNRLGQVFLIELLILLIYICVTYFLTRKGILPLQKLSDLMSEAEKGNYAVRANLNEYREISDLSRQFNSMVEGIQTRDAILKNREIEIKNLAYYDSLTGLPNRTYLQSSLSKLMKNYEGEKEIGFQGNVQEGAILFLDLDGFKTINDTMGHSTGDLVLREVANRLSHNTRYKQMAARIGGDEFVIILEEIETIEVIRKIADRILNILNKPITIKKTRYEIGASIGIVLYPTHGNDAEILLKKADMAMYKAKHNGKNNYQIFEENLEDEIIRRNMLEKEIRKSIKENLFHLNYQPLVSLKTGRISGFEALLRNSNEKLSGFSTIEIISAAEETGMIIKIEKQVLKEGFRFLRKIRDLFNEDYKLSVNISAPHLMQSNFTATIQDEIKLAGIPNSSINIEVTETMMMDSMDAGRAKLQELKERGIGIHMDDFGTGYSSLSYLQNLPISCVKIDKSFIDSIEEDEKKKDIIRLIIDMAHKIGLTTTAEGLETIEQHEYLKSCNCDYVQGFYYSKPLPQKEILNLLENRVGDPSAALCTAQ